MFRLAARLGWSVRRVGEEIDSRELSEWIAFDRIEPFEDGYWQAAMVASTIAQALGSRVTLQDLLPRIEGERREQSPEEGLRVMRGLVAKQANK